MFPTQSKVNRSSSLWLLPIVALVMLLVAYAIFAASKVQAQTPAGDFCIEGIVIDWEENPLSGWAITLTSDITIPGGITMSGGVTSATGVSTTISAFDPDDDDDERWGPDNGNGYDKKGGPDSKQEGGPDYNNQNGPSHDDRNGPSQDGQNGPSYNIARVGLRTVIRTRMVLSSAAMAVKKMTMSCRLASSSSRTCLVLQVSTLRPSNHVQVGKA